MQIEGMAQWGLCSDEVAGKAVLFLVKACIRVLDWPAAKSWATMGLVLSISISVQWSLFSIYSSRDCFCENFESICLSYLEVHEMKQLSWYKMLQSLYDCYFIFQTDEIWVTTSLQRMKTLDWSDGGRFWSIWTTWKNTNTVAEFKFPRFVQGN
jgi:hypothetical protein